jgi:hypothetical protein
MDDHQFSYITKWKRKKTPTLADPRQIITQIIQQNGESFPKLETNQNLRRIFNDVGKLYDKMLQCIVERRPAPGASRFALGIKNTYGCMIPGMTVTSPPERYSIFSLSLSRRVRCNLGELQSRQWNLKYL